MVEPGQNRRCRGNIEQTTKSTMKKLRMLFKKGPKEICETAQSVL